MCVLILKMGFAESSKKSLFRHKHSDERENEITAEACTHTELAFTFQANGILRLLATEF